MHRAVEAADGFWASKGYAVDCPIRVTIVPDLGRTPDDHEIAASAEFGGCGLYVLPRFLELAELAGWTRAEQLDNLTELCMIFAHERGHNLGFAHTESGLMAPVAVPAPVGACKDYAQREAKPRRCKRRRARSAFP